MGYVYSREMKHGEFTVTNTGTISETIKMVEPTCNCITLDEQYRDVVLQPGEVLKIGFTMDASTVKNDEFGRDILISSLYSEPLVARVGGRIIRPMQVLPSDRVDLGKFKDPATPWKQVFQLQSNPELSEPVVLGEPVESPYLNIQLEDQGAGNYEVTITPKGTMPYNRSFHPFAAIPIVKPAGARDVVMVLEMQVGEAVNFAPDQWRMKKSILEKAGSLTERFVYGEVPGIQEERKKGDSATDLKNMMKGSFLKQHNAVPLKFVKENHDWDDLFDHMEFQVPEGVTLNKIRHPQGIELQITVTPQAFEQTNEVQIVPYRDQNQMAPIRLIGLD